MDASPFWVAATDARDHRRRSACGTCAPTVPASPAGRDRCDGGRSLGTTVIFGILPALFAMRAHGADPHWITVVGVVGDVRLAPTLPPAPHAYFPFTQVPDYVTSDVAIGVTADPVSVAAARGVVHGLDPNQPVANVAPFDRLLSDSLARIYPCARCATTSGAAICCLRDSVRRRGRCPVAGNPRRPTLRPS
ncbi:MAG TPA: hypothetical protein VFX12_02290 [Vicinamibacterales bacterium]|nr:hypothetical protein [Vicinamibacterales bacterium]